MRRERKGHLSIVSGPVQSTAVPLRRDAGEGAKDCSLSWILPLELLTVRRLRGPAAGLNVSAWSTLLLASTTQLPTYPEARLPNI